MIWEWAEQGDDSRPVQIGNATGFQDKQMEGDPETTQQSPALHDWVFCFSGRRGVGDRRVKKGEEDGECVGRKGGRGRLWGTLMNLIFVFNYPDVLPDEVSSDCQQWSQFQTRPFPLTVRWRLNIYKKPSGWSFVIRELFDSSFLRTFPSTTEMGFSHQLSCSRVWAPSDPLAAPVDNNILLSKFTTLFAGLWLWVSASCKYRSQHAI